LIQLARDHQRALTVYQCRRWDPDYLAIQQVLKRETIGDVSTSKHLLVAMRILVTTGTHTNPFQAASFMTGVRTTWIGFCNSFPILW